MKNIQIFKGDPPVMFVVTCYYNFETCSGEKTAYDKIKVYISRKGSFLKLTILFFIFLKC